MGLSQDNMAMTLNHLKNSGNYAYHIFKIHELCILYGLCIYVFWVILIIKRDYFPKHH